MSAHDNRETLAIRAAFEAFIETLNRKLEELGDGGSLRELDGSRHVHVSLLVGPTTFVVRTVVQFTSDPAAVALALQLEKGRAAS